jgi:ABC-type lipoprotein release transport system permease subunit
MRAVWRLVAHELSTRWRSWAGLALLAGLAGGVVLATAAGARRTDTAYPRFLQASRASDVLVSPQGTGFGGYYAALGRLPEVRVIAPVAGLFVAPLGPGGTADLSSIVAAPADGRFGHLTETPKLLAGRLPRPDRPGEIAVDQIGAQQLHLHVGSTLAMGAATASAPPTDPARWRHLSERVVGIFVARGSVVPVTEVDKGFAFYASTGLARLLGPRYAAFDGAYVRLRPGTAVASFSRRAQALARRFPGTGGQVFVAEESTQAAAIERSIRPQAVALALFALVLAVTAVLVVGQVATRLLLAASSDNATLAALGMTRAQLTAAGLAQVGAAAAAGAVIAVATAVAVSPLMPIGPARLAEPGPGVSADGTVLGVGAAAMVALLVARVAWAAWRDGSAPGAAGTARAGTSGVVAWLAGAGVPVTAAIGARFALEPGRGRTAVPVRGALAGTALSVLTVVAAFTFGANLLHLVHTPRLYGQSWDVAVEFQFGSVTPQAAERVLRATPGVSGWSFGSHAIIGIGRSVVPAIGLAAGRGPLLAPVLLDGHPPRSSHQIVLGTSVLRRTGRRVGQSVPVTINGRHESVRIVGRAVFPDFGQGGFTPTDLGNGAETAASLLAPPAAGRPAPPSRASYNFVLIRFAPGPRQAAHIAAFRRSMAATCAQAGLTTCVRTDQRPNGVTGYARIDATPEVLAAVLAVLGLAVLGQLMVASARRRRRDFAILKTLGLARRQLSSITAWQASTLAGLALVAGLPLGVAAGHWAWALFARGLGISTIAITPVPLVLATAPAVLIAANAVAFWPGRTTARLRPAQVLRAE